MFLDAKKKCKRNHKETEIDTTYGKYTDTPHRFPNLLEGLTIFENDTINKLNILLKVWMSKVFEYDRGVFINQSTIFHWKENY